MTWHNMPLGIARVEQSGRVRVGGGGLRLVGVSPGMTPKRLGDPSTDSARPSRACAAQRGIHCQIEKTSSKVAGHGAARQSTALLAASPESSTLSKNALALQLAFALSLLQVALHSRVAVLPRDGCWRDCSQHEEPCKMPNPRHAVTSAM